MTDRVRSYINREIGLKADALVLVALSGGADSTALLLILKELGYRLKALHCNFHLRGKESDRDQAFVEELCKQNDVPLSVRHFETEAYAKRRGISIEMAARDLRYEWFRQEQADASSTPNGQWPMVNGQCMIAVAHHRDDQAETLLLNLVRGTGLRGLAAMHPIHDGIIRPLLCLSREEILDYLKSRGQTFVTDSTNAERVAQRNRLRLDVMPLLRSINPAAIEHLCMASENVGQSLPYYNKGIEAAFRELGITTDTFPFSALSENPRPLLHEWLLQKGFNRAQEEEMLRAEKSEVGKMWLSNSHKVLRDRKALMLAPATSSQLADPSAHDVPEVHLSRSIVPCIGETGPNIAYFDADLLKAPIEIRRVREGDAFVPLGMKGRKLVSDYLTDCKVNRLQKANQLVATCGNDIIWLIGHRSDNRYRVTSKTTRILKLIIE